MRPFTQFDETIPPTQADNHGAPDDRPIQDNGTKNAGVSAGGVPGRGPHVDYPLPRDPHAPLGYDPDSEQAEVNDYGLNEAIEVGCADSPNGYGIAGPSAGGENPKNTQG